jgi:hypothetical protein
VGFDPQCKTTGRVSAGFIRHRRPLAFHMIDSLLAHPIGIGAHFGARSVIRHQQPLGLHEMWPRSFAREQGPAFIADP